MQSIKISLCIFSALVLFGLTSCKKDTAATPVDVIYTVSLDGYTATFTNQTKGASSYEWDFGDGTSSTDQSPVHTYPGKGKYVPTLYVKSAGGTESEGSTVIHISKSSAVKLDDNTLSDWDTVSVNSYTSGAAGGIFRKAKFDYSSDYIYFYFEMQSTVANGDIFDFYIDADGNATTGYSTWMWTGDGTEILLEGPMLQNSLDPYYFSGATQTAWSWSTPSISEFYKIGTVVQDGSIVKFEGAFTRSKLKNLTGKAMSLGVTATKNDWSATLGMFPDQGSAAFYLDMSE